jgi:hypothetical protein
VPSQFSVHGTFSIRREGQILFTHVRGPWNYEFAKVWRTAVKPEVDVMSRCGLWGAMTIIEKSMLCTPDAVTELRAAAAHGVKNRNFCAQGIVAAKEVEGRGLVENCYYQLHRDICPFEFFFDQEKAKEWLIERLIEGRYDAQA